MSSIKFRNLTVGDKVQLSDSVEVINIAAGISFEGEPVNPKTFVVMDIHLDSDLDVISIEDGEGTPYSAADDFDIRVIEYANFLPNADYIVWSDWDREKQIAYRDGHPGNNAWVYNGKRYSAEDLAAVTKGHNLSILTVQE